MNHVALVTGAAGAIGQAIARQLSDLTGGAVERCAQVIEADLLAGYHCLDPQTGFPVFAFRLHQFISRGDTVYASLEDEDTRHLTLFRQQYVPGDRSKILLPLAFCRECGQEYYCVRRVSAEANGTEMFIPREVTDQTRSDEGEAGFLYISSRDPWPLDPAAVNDRVPDDCAATARNICRRPCASPPMVRSARAVWTVTTETRVGEVG